MCHISFIHSSVDGQVGCSRFSTIVNNAMMNICVQIFVWTTVFIPPEIVDIWGRIILSQGASWVW